MVDEILQWQEFDIELSRAFSPTTPIYRNDLFQGRQSILRRLIDAVNQAGQHAIIYGERGVGKTSLTNVLSDYLRPFTSTDTEIASARVNCSTETSYRQIWEYLFQAVGLQTNDQIPFDRLTVNDVFNTLRQEESRKLILIVDEFDRIEDPE